MYCPKCGKDNPEELSYCASCGTNLDAVSMALTGRQDDVLTRFDSGIDHFIGRYTDHVFQNSKLRNGENSVVRSWRLLGQAVITSFLDLLLFVLMWNILPLRAMILLISSPIRLLSERSRAQESKDQIEEGYRAPALKPASSAYFASGTVPSVTEETTTNLGNKRGTQGEKAPITDKLE